MEEYGFGALPSPKDIRDYKLSAAAIKYETFPESFKLEPVMIKNQGVQSTCVAHALSSMVEFFNLRDTQHKYQFSTDFIYGCRTDTDYLGEGMFLRDGLKVVQKYGDVLYTQLPGNTNVPTAREKVFANFDILTEQAKPNRISTYYKIKTINEIKYALIHDGPVPASMKWFKDAKVKSDGLYTYTSKEIRSYHAVLILGWDKDKLIIQNSWGKTWGNHGLFYVPFNQIKDIFCEFYGVTDENNVDIIQPTPTLIDFSPIINFILNFIVKYIHKFN